MKGKCKNSLFLYLTLAAILLTSVSSTLAAEKIKIGTALVTHPVFALPMVAAEEKGFWKQQALQVEWVPLRGGAALVRAQAAAAVQMGVDGVVGAVRGMARGVPIIIVSHLGVPDKFGIWVRSNSPVRNPRDLRGKKIDVLRLGGSAHAFGKAVSQALGIEREVSFMGSGGIRNMLAGLKTGAVDSLLGTFFAVGPLWGKGEAREILKVEDYLPKPWPNRVVTSRKDFLARRPQDVGKMVKAILGATDFIMRNKGWTMAKLQSVSRYTPKVAAAIYPMLKFSPDGRMNKQALSNVRKFLIDFRVIKPENAPPVEQLYTNRFTR